MRKVGSSFAAEGELQMVRWTKKRLITKRMYTEDNTSYCTFTTYSNRRAFRGI